MNELCDLCRFERGKDCPAKDNWHNAFDKKDVVSCTKFRE